MTYRHSPATAQAVASLLAQPGHSARALLVTGATGTWQHPAATGASVVLKAITRHAATVTGHRAGCMCRRCAQVRVCAKRYARLRGVLS